MLSCSVVLDPTTHDWKWKESGTYTWQVKAENASEETIAKSAKRSFTADMLTPPIPETPEHGATVPAVFDGLDWELPVPYTGMDAILTYVATLYKKDGSKMSTATYYDVNCASPCGIDFTIVGMGSGELRKFTWMVVGKRSGVSGKATSETFTVKVYIP
jgi:hypothetical protein